jgi:hypothetical protein
MSFLSEVRLTLAKVKQLYGEVIRDFTMGYQGSDSSYQTSLFMIHKAVGLDIMLHNRGSTDISLKLDGQTIKTIAGGEVFSMNDTVFDIVSITNSGSAPFELLVQGCKIIMR